jgi:phosphoenolpyruvate---glycerone phosphotransferase subunit DhaL
VGTPDGPTVLDHGFVVRFVRTLDGLLGLAERHLTELDAAIGDADHGTNMTRGLHAAVLAVDEAPVAGPGAGFATVGQALTRAIGGASGPLYGTLFITLGHALPDGPPTDGAALAAGLNEALRGTQRLGAAVVGDKTMVDAIAPAVAEFERQIGRGAGVRAALGAAAIAADRGARATTPLRARKGRASYLGIRSEGHQDPGATSSVLVFEALYAAAATPSVRDGVGSR